MATLDFPVDPIVGQEYEFKSYTYQWDGEKWKTIGIGYNPVNDLRDEVAGSIREAIRRSYQEAGYNLVDGSFELGGVLHSTSDVLLHQLSGKAYSWDGAYPVDGYVVAPGTDPTAVTGYGPRTDVVLRSEINVVQRRFASVAEMKSKITSDDVGKVVEWVGYYSAFDGGGNRGLVVSAGTGIDDGGSFFDCTSGVQVKADLSYYPKLKQFGAYLNDSNDDTIAYQNFVNYIQASHVIGIHDCGTAKISSAISFKATYGWGIVGKSMTTSVVKQYADNTPCFSLGNVVLNSLHSYLLQELGFDYANVQPATNLTANPIRFHVMGYEGTFKRLRFDKGSWAIGLASGVGCPWGNNWDDLIFGSGLRGGAVNWTGGTNAVPNNKWGRLFVDAANMAGPIFQQVKGYNWVIDLIEIVGGTNVQWFNAQAGSKLNLLAIKQEIGKYNASLSFAGNALMYFPLGNLLIDSIALGGTAELTIYQPITNLYLANVSTGTIQVRNLTTDLVTAPSNFYLFSGGGKFSEICYISKGTNPIPYTLVGSSDASSNLIVSPDQNNMISPNKGDADYTITLGDPCTIVFETSLTANRVVTLPAGNSNTAGLRYRIISNGAVGTYTISIVANGITKATLTANNTFVDIAWRWSPVPHAGWVVVGKGVTV